MIRIRKKQIGKNLIQRINQIEEEHNVHEKPFFAIIGKLPDGRFEVSEHVGIGKGKGNVKFRSVKCVNRTFDSIEDYTKLNPSWTVILEDISDDDDEGSLSIADVCKEALFGDPSKIKILNERMDLN